MRVVLLVLVGILVAGAFASLNHLDGTRHKLQRDDKRRSLIHDPEPTDCVDMYVNVLGKEELVHCNWHDGTYIMETYGNEAVQLKAFGISYAEARDRLLKLVAKANHASGSDESVGLGV